MVRNGPKPSDGAVGNLGDLQVQAGLSAQSDRHERHVDLRETIRKPVQIETRSELVGARNDAYVARTLKMRRQRPPWQIGRIAPPHQVLPDGVHERKIAGVSAHLSEDLPAGQGTGLRGLRPRCRR